MAGMELLIRLDTHDPPTGTICVTEASVGYGDVRDLPFAGWLGFVSLLYEVLGPVSVDGLPPPLD